MKNEIKIVVTGGPGGGKTTALDLFQREFKDQVKIVPEAATMLFKSGIKREVAPEKVKFIQIAIYDLQLTLESVFTFLDGQQLLICDRGTLDGLAYWPDKPETFFQCIESNLEKELARYDAVIFFETAAASGNEIIGNNPYRTESTQKAIDLDKKLQTIWSQHKHYYFVPSSQSFMTKINTGLSVIHQVIEKKSK